MQLGTMLVFAATVLPLDCTPGPDILFVASQGLSGGARAEMPGSALIRRGFLTSFLNPKGLMVYLAILPNFMTSGDGVALQAVVLSAIFIALCGIIYSAVGFVVSSIAR